MKHGTTAKTVGRPCVLHPNITAWWPNSKGMKGDQDQQVAMKCLNVQF
jgi:hypothetical protein